jgi:hypothetical protein
MEKPSISYDIRTWPVDTLDKMLYTTYISHQNVEFDMLASTGRISGNMIDQIWTSESESDNNDYARFAILTKYMPKECVDVMHATLKEDDGTYTYSYLPSNIIHTYLANGGDPSYVRFSLIVDSIRSHDIQLLQQHIAHVPVDKREDMIMYVFSELPVINIPLAVWLVVMPHIHTHDIVLDIFTMCCDETKNIDPRALLTTVVDSTELIDVQPHPTLVDIRNSWIQTHSDPVPKIEHLWSIFNNVYDGKIFHPYEPNDYYHHLYLAIQYHRHDALRHWVNVHGGDIRRKGHVLMYAVEMCNERAIAMLQQHEPHHAMSASVKWSIKQMTVAIHCSLTSPSNIPFSWYSSGDRVNHARQLKWCLPGHVVELYNLHMQAISLQLVPELGPLVMDYVEFEGAHLIHHRRVVRSLMDTILKTTGRIPSRMRAALNNVTNVLAFRIDHSHAQILDFCGY